MMERVRVRAVSAAFAAAIAAGAAFGAAAQSVLGAGGEDRPAKSYLHAGWAEADGRRVAGLRVELQPGWKTYWRKPGDSGIPPQFDWTGSENVAALRIAWPAPAVFDTYGARTIGYHDRMVLPLAVTARDPAKPVRLRLALFYGLCSDICIPARDDLALDIAPDAPPEGEYFIRSALAKTPRNAAQGGVSAATCGVAGAGEERVFSARLTYAEPPVSPPVIVAEGPDGVWFGPVETRLDGAEVVASASVQADPGVWIGRDQLRLTIVAPSPALFIDGCAAG